MLDQLECDLANRIRLMREFVGRRPRLRIATLGPSGTSSEAAARYLLRQASSAHGELELCDTYEDAARQVADGRADIVLVANAFGGINDLYMSPALHFLASFVFQTPPYGVAGPRGTVIAAGRSYSIATHPAPVSLIPWFLERTPVQYQAILSPSTSAAARAVRDGTYDLCVTNAVAAEMYGLTFLTRTRPIRMLWSLFSGEASGSAETCAQVGD